MDVVEASTLFLYICVMFRQRVQRFIDDQSLFGIKDKVLVALSGGADSVALLRVLVALGYRCECAHCNFHLRGEESDRDEEFVRCLCKASDVLLHVKHFATEEYAHSHGVSIEMAARELRYAWFEELRKEREASVIVVAHHRDDSVETMMLNLIRGTGIHGLKGIQAKNGRVVRPLLQESRESIEEYLKFLGQDYVTDSTNLQDEYMRNKIRLNILPLMKELNPSVMESIFETGERLTEVAGIYQRDRNIAIGKCVVKEDDDSCRMRIVDILSDIAPASLLHEWLSPYGFHTAQEKDIMRCLRDGQSGKRFCSKEWELLRDREELIVRRIEMQEEIPELVIEEKFLTPDFVIPFHKEIACIDADKLKEPLYIRRWRQGDKFVPFGMKGRKKVSDYLTDRKFSLYQKENQCVVCSGEDIVWLVNERSDNRYRVTEKTRRVLLLSIK